MELKLPEWPLPIWRSLASPGITAFKSYPPSLYHMSILSLNMVQNDTQKISGQCSQAIFIQLRLKLHI